MTGFKEHNGNLYIDDVAISDIAKEIPTPFYLYSASKITERYTALKAALDAAWSGAKKPMIAFACKANSNIAVINLLASLGAGADVVSGGELQRALAAGVPANRIVFSGVGKTDAELTLAINNHIHQINVESAPELNALEKIAQHLNKKVSIALRFTPDVDCQAHAKTSTGEDDHKFGLVESEILALADRFKNHPYIHLRAISMHIGSGVPSLDPFQDAFHKTANLVKTLRAYGLAIDTVDLGGGIWIPYRNEPQADLNAYATMISSIFEPLDVQIMLEPGRILVAESGALISKVIYIKNRPETSGSKTFAIVDAAMNDLIRPTLYEAHHPIVPISNTSDKTETTYDIVGPVCETGDYLALDRTLPTLKSGDHIAILCAGAYGSAMSSTYNSRPLITEIMVKGSAYKIIRAQQNIQDIWKDEKIPNWNA